MRAAIAANGYSKALDAQRARGLTIPEAAAKVTHKIDTAAITEASQAFTRGQSDALIQVPRVSDQLWKVWDAVRDKRTCPVCWGAHGTIVRARDPFPQGEPGAVHPRCRCSALYLGADELGLRSGAVNDATARAKPSASPAQAPAQQRALGPRPTQTLTPAVPAPIPTPAPRRRESTNPLPFPDTPLGRQRLALWEAKRRIEASHWEAARLRRKAAADRDRARRDARAAQRDPEPQLVAPAVRVTPELLPVPRRPPLPSKPKPKPTREKKLPAPIARLERDGIAGKSIDDLFPGVGSRGMRDASLEFLRAGGAASEAMPVTFAIEHDGKLRGIDGRHRITVARERGDEFINVKVILLGPRGGTKWEGFLKIRI